MIIFPFEVQLLLLILMGKISLQTLLKIPGFTDNIVTHLFAGLGAGFFAVCIGSPVDVVIYLLSIFTCSDCYLVK